MFRWNHNCKRSDSLSRFVSIVLVGSTLLFSLGLPLNSDAQELYSVNPGVSTGSASASSESQGNDRIRPRLMRIFKGVSHNLFRAPQNSGAAVAPNHEARKYALLGLLFLATGGVLLAEGENQSCLRSGTCTGFKISGALLLTAGGLGLVIAAAEAGKHNSTQVNAGAPSSSGPSFPSSVPSTSVNRGDLAAAQSAIDQIQNEPHTEAPPVQAVGPGYGGATSITVQNNTPDTLSVYLAGPSGLVMTLPPQGSQTAQLSPGFYRVGGRVSDSSVEPFLGTASFQGGYRYQEVFYISAQP